MKFVNVFNAFHSKFHFQFSFGIAIHTHTHTHTHSGICQFNESSSRVECFSLCETRNMTPCVCAMGSVGECSVCCRSETECTPEVVNGTMIPLSNGVTCGENNICVAVSSAVCL